jgi:hypothetical protein
MASDKEPVGYEKTVLSDLQGAWQNLRDTVVEQARYLAARPHAPCTTDEQRPIMNCD